MLYSLEPSGPSCVTRPKPALQMCPSESTSRFPEIPPARRCCQSTVAVSGSGSFDVQFDRAQSTPLVTAAPGGGPLGKTFGRVVARSADAELARLSQAHTQRRQRELEEAVIARASRGLWRALMAM